MSYLSIKRNTLLATSIASGVAGLLAATPVSSQSGGEFVLTSTTIDGGGGRSTGGDLVLTGTIGQFDASPQSATGGSLKLAGGFWAKPRDVVVSDIIFSSGFESE